eukprot:TRINITY_DN7115_c0_g1_i1.p1 TRINITY_DN7115_c0_g1~~TRINITY_DN7115_c0_g1_i1.p1  ORF type:complete len:351 (+),score=89.67 TRINITY_DN7115_c0_g1_i1:610-1662(+)
MAAQPGWFGPDQYTNLANPSAHFRTTGPELWKQTQGEITHFVASLGTCGTITGTGTYLRQHNPGVTVIAAHPPEGHDIPGVRSKIQAEVTAHFKPELYDELVEVSNIEAFDMCRRLNQEASMIAGPSSGLNLMAALKAVPDQEGNCAVVVFCDDIWKYTNSCAKHLPELFGPREQQLTPELKRLQQILDVAQTSVDSLDGRAAKRFLKQAQPVLLDVRPVEQYNASLRAAEALSAPLGEMLEGAEVASLPADKSTPLLVYCNRGVDSLYAMSLLKAKGYHQVKHVVDGMFEWWRTGLPTENQGGNLPMPKDATEKKTVQEYKAKASRKKKTVQDYISPSAEERGNRAPGL